jgi:large subunit ribosomal protein L30
VSGAASDAKARIRLKQVKSEIGSNQRQRATLRGLGIRRMHKVVEVEDTPAVRGMINKVTHLIQVVPAKVEE